MAAGQCLPCNDVLNILHLKCGHTYLKCYKKHIMYDSPAIINNHVRMDKFVYHSWYMHACESKFPIQS